MTTTNGLFTKGPHTDRLNYFYGQMLGVRELQAEQQYFLGKARRHNACLHGYGVVCGLDVVPEPVEEDCPPEDAEEAEQLRKQLEQCQEQLRKCEEELQQAKDKGYRATVRELDKRQKELQGRRERLLRNLEKLGARNSGQRDVDQRDRETSRARLHVLCGYALDCCGNELLVSHTLAVDLWACLSAKDRRRVENEKTRLWVSLYHQDKPVDPVRPVVPDTCGASASCEYGMIRDTVCVRVTVDEPRTDKRCELCCTPCKEPCLPIAKIDDFQPGKPLRPQQIHLGVRRRLTTYVHATIDGISWTHGATYSRKEAEQILGHDKEGGIEIQFSRPVLRETLVDGVIDVWVVEGGLGRSAQIYHKAGKIISEGAGKTTRSVVYRDLTEELLQPGDRVLITVRSAFILDSCCRPVDGFHVGGRVPILERYRKFERVEKETPTPECRVPPWGYPPWTSGTGAAGGTFESWFWVERKPGKRPGKVR